MSYDELVEKLQQALFETQRRYREASSGSRLPER